MLIVCYAYIKKNVKSIYFTRQHDIGHCIILLLYRSISLQPYYIIVAWIYALAVFLTQIDFYVRRSCIGLGVTEAKENIVASLSADYTTAAWKSDFFSLMSL